MGRWIDSRSGVVGWGVVVVACLGSIGGWRSLLPHAAAADTAADYETVIAGRADKILDGIAGLSSESRGRVRESLLAFSRSVNAWHEAHGPRRKELRAAEGDEARGEAAALDRELATIRDEFVKRLSNDLSPSQVEQVKDGLTYNVAHVTERAYHEMIERLTDEQKAKIHGWLVEARDQAISEGSSEAKHGVFGRYKGRINNYLSQQGYDLKHEERGWQARRKAAAEAKRPTEKIEERK